MVLIISYKVFRWISALAVVSGVLFCVYFQDCVVVVLLNISEVHRVRLFKGNYNGVS